MAKRIAQQPQPPDGWQPTQPVPDPILNSPYDVPTAHWVYQEGRPYVQASRRPASYWFTTQKVGKKQAGLFAEEQRDELDLVNLLRKDVERWRSSKPSPYEGATPFTKELLAWWARPDARRRLFFCQREGIETLIYLLEIALPIADGLRPALRWNTEVSPDTLRQLLRGDRPAFAADAEFFPRLIDPPQDGSFLPLRRLGCKMATGSGKTTVMAALITWAFVNRGRNPATTRYPNAVLVCAPNLTVRKRLAVLYPENPDNIYDQFELVPPKYRELVNAGKVLVTNWHVLALASEHKEGDASYRVVNKGEEEPGAFTKNRLGDLAARLPILVLNDEGHHCWRPKPGVSEDEALKGVTGEEKKALEEDIEEARIWLAGLDRINNCGLLGKDKDGRPVPGILAAVDLSATPFYLGNSGYPEGLPFPWLVSDFGLVDAIECGIVKVPRLPVRDDKAKLDEAGRPVPQFFKVWEDVRQKLRVPTDFLGKKPKPDAVYKYAESALTTLASQWKRRFDELREDAGGQPFVPPVLIVVCDNTDIAQTFYERISGEYERETLDEKGTPVAQTMYGSSHVLPEFANEPGVRRTVRIDTKLLAKIETEGEETKDEAAKALRNLIDSVGKRGGPGEQVRCVVSVSMLTEGWDANNVMHILGVRAFGSQLLCEQVVGRGLRRMNYTPQPDEQGVLKLPAEYVDVYGIPFSLIPYKGKPTDTNPKPDPVYHRVHAVKERAAYEIRFPVVESYTYDLRDSGISCDVEKLDRLYVNAEPTTVWLSPTRGYQEGTGPLAAEDTVMQTREEFYRSVRKQQVIFRLAQLIVEDLVGGAKGEGAQAIKDRGLASHLIFPSVVKILEDYIRTRVEFGPNTDVRELALLRYAQLVRERIRDSIVSSAASAQKPLLPVLNSYQRYVTTAGVEYSTTRPTYPLTKSHLNAAVFRSRDERDAIDVLEDLDCVDYYAPNDRQIGMTILYEYLGHAHKYEPDFVVRLRSGRWLVLEIKGLGGKVFGDDLDRVEAKNAAARKWVTAINNTGRFGSWQYEISEDTAELRRLLMKAAGAADGLPFRIEPRPFPEERFKVCLPLVTLPAMVRRLRAEQRTFDDHFDWAAEWAVIENPPVPLAWGQFVARVPAHLLPPGAGSTYGVFRLWPVQADTDRQGRTLLVAHSALYDARTGRGWGVGIYESSEEVGPDGAWRKVRVTLRGTGPDAGMVSFSAESEGTVSVIAELAGIAGAEAV
jgi:type III restriction enzyme